MLIWTRLGFLVPVLALGGFSFTEYAIELVFHDSLYFQVHQWPVLLSASIAGLAIWLLGRRLNRDARKLLIDPDTGKEVLLLCRHTFLFMPMQYWGIAVGAVGVAAWLTV